MRLKKLERFKLWRLDAESDLQRQLANYLLVLAAYFDREEISFTISDGMSFLDGLDHLLQRLNLKAWPIGKDGSKLKLHCPLLARDRRDDSLALLLPRRHYYVAVKSDEIVTISKVREYYDEIMQIFSVNNNLTEKKFSSTIDQNLFRLPRGPFIVASVLTMMLMAVIIFLTMAQFYEFADVNFLAINLGVAFSIMLVMVIVDQGQAVSLKNFASAAVEIFHDFYRRIFHIAIDQFIVKSPMQFQNMADRLRFEISNHFLERFRLVSCVIGLIISAILSLTLSVWCTLFIALSFVVVGIVAFHDRGEKNLHEQVYKDSMQKILANYALSLDALRGLKAFTPILKKLHATKGFLVNEMLHVYVRRNAQQLSYVLLPIFYVLILAIFMREKLEIFSPWQKSVAIIVAIGVGLMLAHLINHRRKINKFTLAEVDQWPREPADAHVDPVNLRGQLEITNMTFGYKDMGSLIFKNYSQELLPKKFYNFYGESGSGKSTLLALLLGFLNPSSGQIIFDNQDIRSLDKEKLRRHFGVILESATLFPGSVYDNIVCGRAISKKSLENLLLSHGIFDHVIDLPMGLETFVFWHQRNLSRLEKTIVLLARALVHEPIFLFIDDIFVGLPINHKEELLSFVNSLDITRIVMTTTRFDDDKESTIIKLPLQNSTETS